MALLPRRTQFWGLLGWLIASYATSAIGAFATLTARSFYGTLDQPDWAPPSWLFGPVWTGLYTLMAIAAWLVWRSGGWRENKTALTVFVTQLLFNSLWSWLFFAWNLGAIAFVEIVVLWALILTTIMMFRKTNKIAAALLIPYILWVSFAALLNLALWQMNPDILG